MVVAVGQTAKLPVESLSAGVLGARFTPTVAAPVAERFHELRKVGSVGEDAAAFAHRQMMRRVKADCAEIAERSRPAAHIGRADSVAVVFNEPQLVTLS